MAKVIKKKRGRPALAKKPIKVVKKKVAVKTTAKKVPVKRVAKAAPKRGRPIASKNKPKESKVGKGKLSNIVIDLSYGDCLNFFSQILTRLNDIHDYITKDKEEGSEEEGGEDENFIKEQEDGEDKIIFHKDERSSQS